MVCIESIKLSMQEEVLTQTNIYSSMMIKTQTTNKSMHSVCEEFLADMNSNRKARTVRK